MKYISVFSGVEAASVAWEPLGWEPVAFSEIDPFPCAVLADRFPQVPNLGDISNIDWSAYHGTIDLVAGGSPCQSFSVAGKREGLAGASGLMWEYIRCVREVMPRYFVWENVPGALSSEGGGQPLDSCCSPWMTSGITAHGEYWMRSFSESPNDAGVSFLSAVLQTDVPQKYCLSVKACAGILRRAKERGRDLPPMLQDALEAVIADA